MRSSSKFMSHFNNILTETPTPGSIGLVKFTTRQGKSVIAEKEATRSKYFPIRYYNENTSAFNPGYQSSALQNEKFPLVQ